MIFSSESKATTLAHLRPQGRAEPRGLSALRSYDCTMTVRGWARSLQMFLLPSGDQQVTPGTRYKRISRALNAVASPLAGNVIPRRGRPLEAAVPFTAAAGGGRYAAIALPSPPTRGRATLPFPCWRRPRGAALHGTRATNDRAKFHGRPGGGRYAAIALSAPPTRGGDTFHGGGNPPGRAARHTWRVF